MQCGKEWAKISPEHCKRNSHRVLLLFLLLNYWVHLFSPTRFLNVGFGGKATCIINENSNGHLSYRKDGIISPRQKVVKYEHVLCPSLSGWTSWQMPSLLSSCFPSASLQQGRPHLNHYDTLGSTCTWQKDHKNTNKSLLQFWTTSHRLLHYSYSRIFIELSIILFELLFRSSSPVLISWDGGERWVEAVCVEGHITLITQQLLVWVLLHPTYTAVTPTAVFLGVILTVFTLWPVGSWTPIKKK